jgi:hypothetical protein
MISTTNMCFIWKWSDGKNFTFWWRLLHRVLLVRRWLCKASPCPFRGAKGDTTTFYVGLHLCLPNLGQNVTNLLKNPSKFNFDSRVVTCPI